jgi:hypothetical protein
MWRRLSGSAATEEFYTPGALPTCGDGISLLGGKARSWSPDLSWRWRRSQAFLVLSPFPAIFLCSALEIWRETIYTSGIKHARTLSIKEQKFLPP